MKRIILIMLFLEFIFQINSYSQELSNEVCANFVESLNNTRKINETLNARFIEIVASQYAKEESESLSILKYEIIMESLCKKISYRDKILERLFSYALLYKQANLLPENYYIKVLGMNYDDAKAIYKYSNKFYVKPEIKKSKGIKDIIYRSDCYVIYKHDSVYKKHKNDTIYQKYKSNDFRKHKPDFFIIDISDTIKRKIELIVFPLNLFIVSENKDTTMRFEIVGPVYFNNYYTDDKYREPLDSNDNSSKWREPLNNKSEYSMYTWVEGDPIACTLYINKLSKQFNLYLKQDNTQNQFLQILKAERIIEYKGY